DPGWRIPGESGAGTVDPRALLVRLDAKLPAQRTLTTDAGHFQGFPPMHLRVPDAQGFVMTQAFQSVGLGVATGIGAAVARTDRSLADLETGPLDDWIRDPHGPFLLDGKVDPRIRAEWLQEAFRGGA